MSEPRYDADTLRRAAAAAARLQSERDARGSGGPGASFSAEEIEAMAADAGLDPRLMRQALGQVLGADDARRRHARLLRRWLTAGAAALLAAAFVAVWLYRGGMERRTIRYSSEGSYVGPDGRTRGSYTRRGTYTESRTRGFSGSLPPPIFGPAAPPAFPAAPTVPRSPMGPMAPAGPPFPVRAAAPATAPPDLRHLGDQNEVTQRIETEISAFRARDVAALREIHAPSFVFIGRDGRTRGYADVMAAIAGLPGYPPDWLRDARVVRLAVQNDWALAVLDVTTRWTESDGSTRESSSRVQQTWTQLGGVWRKTEEREL